MKRIFALQAATAVCLLLVSASYQAYAQDQPQAAPAQGRDMYGILADEKHIYCPKGLEQILPGDFYACEARGAFAREKYKNFLHMLQLSADWANKDAQFLLGLTYFNGETPDIPQNRPLGLAWLALAAERKKPYYTVEYNAARARSTPEELQQADALEQTLKKKYGDAVAAPRAIRNFNREVEPIDEAAFQNATTYIPDYAPVPMISSMLALRLHDEADADFNTYQGTVSVGKPEWLQNEQQTIKNEQEARSSKQSNGTNPH